MYPLVKVVSNQNIKVQRKERIKYKYEVYLMKGLNGINITQSSIDQFQLI